GTVLYTYDNGDRRTSMSVPGQPVVNYGYDDGDRLTQITQGAAAVAFTYDTLSRRTSTTLPNGVTAQFTYDSASRLTGIGFKKGSSSLGALIYGYDSAGRRTQISGSLARTGLPQVVTSASYGASNQQTGFAGVVLSYDLNGNLISDGNNTYTWNSRDR